MQVGPVLWRYCHVLRHDGMDYGQYLDQITYLLFLQMWTENGAEWWTRLHGAKDEDVLNVYDTLLTELANTDGLIGDIFDGARAEFQSPANLTRLVDLIDEIRWADLDRDIQADAFEYLLERAAAEGKKGAGQYFTPRNLMRAIVHCIEPGSREQDKLIADPAVGTGGFLLAAKEHMDAAGITNDIRFWGTELVQRPRRLALMNAILHGLDIEAIDRGDALNSPMRFRPNVVLANPPFGSQAGTIPPRPDFWFRTANKQANFVQHIALGIADDGRAGIVVPDNCFFGDIAKGLLPGLLKHVNLHTILRLPDGTFSPYTAGTKTNVMFFDAGAPTDSIRLYDARNHVDRRRQPLADGELQPFIDGFKNRSVESNWVEDPQSRWTRFSVTSLQAVDYELDRLPWSFTPAAGHDVSWTASIEEARALVSAVQIDIDHLYSLMAETD